MSWSDDIRCLYCDGKLPLYRKLTNGQFCSATHRKAYWQEQEKLALERLTQTRDSLLSQRKAESSPASLSMPVSNPVFIESQFPLHAQEPSRSYVAYNENEAMARSASNTDRVVSAGFLRDSGLRPLDWLAICTFAEPEPIRWATLEPMVPHQLSDRLVRNFAMADSVEIPRDFQGFSLLLPSPVSLEMQSAHLLPSLARGGNFGELHSSGPLSLVHLVNGKVQRGRSFAFESAPILADSQPSLAGLLKHTHPFTPELDLDLAATLEQASVDEIENESTPAVAAEAPAAGLADSALETGTIDPIMAVGSDPSSDVVIMDGAFDVHAPALVEAVELASEPATGASLEAAPVEVPVAASIEVAIKEAIVEEPAPAMASPVPMPSFAARTRTFAVAAEISDIATEGSAPQPPTSNVRLAEPVPSSSNLLTLPLRQPAQDLAFAAPLPEALSFTSGQHNVELGQFGFPKSLSASAQLQPNFAPGARYSIELRAGVIGAQAEEKPFAHSLTPVILPLPAEIRVAVEPGDTGVLPLPFRPAICEPSAFATSIPELELLAAAAAAPMLVRANLKPVDGENAPMPKRKLFGMEIWTPVASGDPKHVWNHATDFWQNAPRDLKLLVVAIPVLLGLALHPSLPKVRVTAPATTSHNIEEIKGGVGNGLSRQFQLVKRSVADRAAVALNEEFRSGLDDWQARGDLSSGWSFDRNGFVKPGALAFYQPTMRLTDYETQFLGLIDQKALSFVARAKDFDNYYVIKIAIVKPGPVPTIGVTRYAVIDGKPQDRKDTIAPITARPDMLYRVGLSVQGDTFLLTLQGQVTDSWTEPRLNRGGIGFFAARGEESRLRWVQVTHQYDMLGRLCAFLAPQNIPNTDGSW